MATGCTGTSAAIAASCVRQEYFSWETLVKKTVLVVPEAPAPGATAIVDERRIEKRGIRLGVLDNSKGNADYLLQFIVETVKSAIPVTSVVMLRKGSVSLPAPGDMLDRLTSEADVVISAMAD